MSCPVHAEEEEEEEEMDDQWPRPRWLGPE